MRLQEYADYSSSARDTNLDSLRDSILNSTGKWDIFKRREDLAFELTEQGTIKSTIMVSPPGKVFGLFKGDGSLVTLDRSREAIIDTVDGWNWSAEQWIKGGYEIRETETIVWK